MDSRQDGKYFPAVSNQEQDHRFLSDGLFFLIALLYESSMIQQSTFLNSFLILLTSLCLGSLVILSLIPGTAFTIVTMDDSPEQCECVELVELDDDLLTAREGVKTAANALWLKCCFAQVTYQASFFAPQTPPPEFS